MDGGVIKPSGGGPEHNYPNECAFAGGHKIVKIKNYTWLGGVGGGDGQG